MLYKSYISFNLEANMQFFFSDACNNDLNLLQC